MENDQDRQVIAAANAALRAEFIRVIAQANGRLLKQTDTAEPEQITHLIVIGVAFWSRPDLQALNQLAEKFSGETSTVFVFDIDEFGFTDGIKAFIPGVEMPNKTPVVAEYIHGTLVGTHEGDAAFKWIKELERSL